MAVLTDKYTQVNFNNLKLNEMNIQSWIGKSVRIKREFIVSRIDENGVECWESNIPHSPINQFLTNAKDEIFYVLQDVWGADLFFHRRDSVDTSTLELKHQLILRGGLMGYYRYVWDANHFEVVD